MNLKNILNNLEFKNINFCNKLEVAKIRNLRNNSFIRENSVNKKIITIKEHLAWAKKIKTSKHQFFYCIIYKDKIIGGLELKNYNKNLLIGEWAYYVATKSNFVGLGASIEFKAIDYLFNFFKLKKLFCYVLDHNLKVIKLHYKFGFKEISYKQYPQYKNLNLQNSKYLCLNASKWADVEKIIYNKFFI